MLRLKDLAQLGLALLPTVTIGCSGEPAGTPTRCAATSRFPYAEGHPYVGVHANAQNNDFVPCVLPDTFAQSWQVLKGRGIVFCFSRNTAQPAP